MIASVREETFRAKAERGLAGPSQVSNSQQVHRAARNKHQCRRNEGGIFYFIFFFSFHPCIVLSANSNCNSHGPPCARTE